MLGVAVFLTTFVYRFNALGGAFGGFSNDEFGYLARARQIQAGDVPFRDFNDPGWFLTDYVSAAAQWAGGYNLRSEALLTVGLLSVAAVLTFLLARRAAGSYVAALIAMAIHIALEPRHYNYPKILLCAVALVLAWAYLDKPSTPRLWALGAIAGIGFLFRHDYLVYLAVLATVTIVMAHRTSVRDAARAAAVAGTAAAAFVLPFLLFLALNGGVDEYFRTALVYVQRDAARTSFTLPTFSLNASKPLIAVTREAPEQDGEINVRWSGASDEARRSREIRYGLAGGVPVDKATWTYRLTNLSSSNIESLVRDPLVEDTHGIDRNRFALLRPEQPLRLETQLDSVDNATAVLYYTFLALPFVAGLVLAKIGRSNADTRAWSSGRYLIPLLALAVLLNMGFLSRGSTNIRIPDVGVTSAILLAWLLSVLMGRDVRLIASSRVARAALRAGLIVVLCLTVLSVNGLTQPMHRMADAGFTRGPLGVVEQTVTTWKALGAPPPTITEDREQPRVLRLAGYLNACTAPEDRVFVLGVYPELYYFADRRFAGGHAWLLPLYYSDDPDETRIVNKLKEAHVPIVITEGNPLYGAVYRPVFEQLDAYLEDNYLAAGEVDAGGPAPLRVLARRDLTAARRYQPLDLPCFVPPVPAAVR